MKFAKILGVALGLLLALVVAAPMAHADTANQMTKLVFTKPVQIPGKKVLPSGTYWFRIADNIYDPNTVVIYNTNRTQVEAVLETRPAYRTTRLGHLEITLAQGSHRRPVTLTRWFYPGMNYGHAFIYSPRTEKRIHHEEARNIIVQPTTNIG